MFVSISPRASSNKFRDKLKPLLLFSHLPVTSHLNPLVQNTDVSHRQLHTHNITVAPYHYDMPVLPAMPCSRRSWNADLPTRSWLHTHTTRRICLKYYKGAADKLRIYIRKTPKNNHSTRSHSASYGHLHNRDTRRWLSSGTLRRVVW
jgi:hypothetical protein